MKNLDFLEPHEQEALEAIIKEKRERWRLAKQLLSYSPVRITLWGLLTATGVSFFVAGFTAFIDLTVVIKTVGIVFFCVWGLWTIVGCIGDAWAKAEKEATAKRKADEELKDRIEAEVGARYRSLYNGSGISRKY